jgi:hypothetical protein
MADPGELAARLVQANWPKFGTIRKACMYNAMPVVNFDPAVRTINTSPTSQTPLQIIFDIFSITSKMAPEQLADEDTIKTTDEKAMFPRLDLDPVVPKIGDIIVKPDSSEWRVMAMSKDPVPALYELHVRKLST